MRSLLQLLLLALFPLLARGERLNVLFISADDLRVEPLALTPNLDRLAKRSRVFTNAHCQQAVCNPSRASLFTGLRPDTLRIWDLGTHFRETTPDAVTLPQHFKNHGYTSIGIGKNFHNWKQDLHGDPVSWSQPEEFHWGNHGDDKPIVSGPLPENLARDPACQCRDVPDEAYLDGRITAKAIEQLRALKKSGQPFFLAPGFWKPHKPFNAPKKYWDLYQRSEIPLPAAAGWPEGTHRIAWHGSSEMLGWNDKPRKLSDDAVREIRHGYLAAISYLDAQIGKLLDELDALGLRESTIVVLWSDHGYHLGEHTLWAKTSNFDLDTRVPLMISTPGLAAPGAAAKAPVELLDLFPTLNELCALPAVSTLEGASLRPMLEDPAASVKQGAISQFPRPAYYNGSPEAMGYTVCTATHRYSEWRHWKSGKLLARELYDHQADHGETRNLANAPASAELVARLAPLLPVATARAAPPAATTPPPPPGTIIHHSPAASGRYIGSPSICILPNGDYLASHDLFGPKSNEHVRAQGRLYRSPDKGVTWKHLTDFDGFFWTGLFVHKGHVYTLGNDKHHGNIVIRRSTDNGKTWTDPIIIAEGQFHSAPMPVIEHDGRIWRAMEDAHTSNNWGERYRALMLSARADADLLDPASWTLSNAIARETQWLPDGFRAWLEGNAVADPNGNLVNILRVDNTTVPEKAAIVRISKDGKTATFNPEKDIIDFPGGSKKFTIRKDPAGPGYWTLATIIPDRHARKGVPAAIRNTLALLHSKNLTTWEIRSVLLYHPDTAKHGFQYVDWQFEGNDIIAACRTAWDDAEGGARNNHDANFLTFHRWENFRELSRKDDVPMPEFIPITHETDKLTITGSDFQIASLKDGERAFSNRGYNWAGIPDSLLKMSFTRLPGGAKPILEVTAKTNTNIRIATATDQDPIDLSGWKPTRQSFSYDDPRKTRLHIHTRALKQGETLRLPTGSWTGAILILD
jgi:iduronate 2-sulfatase